MQALLRRIIGERTALRPAASPWGWCCSSPLALAPVFLPPPQAHVRGDSQRVAINAQREAYMYDDTAPLPVVRLALEDVRPRLDEQPGLRVCLRTYSYFYLPIGFMYLDMTPEGVHSNNGGTLPRDGSCWR